MNIEGFFVLTPNFLRIKYWAYCLLKSIYSIKGEIPFFKCLVYSKDIVIILGMILKHADTGHEFY